MERGPIALDARPITIAKSFPNNNASSNSNNDTPFSHGYGYGSLYSSSTDYYNNTGDGGGGDSGGSDDSDQKWNVGHGATVVAKNKSKSINNIVRGDVRSGKGVVVERGFGGGGRGGRVSRNPMNEKPREYYDGGESDEDGDDSDGDEEEDQLVAEEGGSVGRGGMRLAAEIRGFTERFMVMERKKIEIMQETESFRMDMEKKRMEMIVEAQRKMVDTIGRAFGAHKRAKMAQES